MAGRNVNMTITTGDTYIPGDEDLGLETYVNDLMFRLEAAQNLDSYKTDFEAIREELEYTAKSFVEENGTVKTGKLLNSIRAEITGNTIKLGVPGVHYAGHIEWGFTSRDGMPHGPWPFIRPAMHLVSGLSTNRLGETMSQIISTGKVGSSGRIQFGRHDPLSISSDRNFMARAFKTDKSVANNNRGWVKAANGIRGTNWQDNFERFNYHGEL